MQDGYRDPLGSIAKLLGEKSIITGVELDTSDPINVSDGSIVYQGEIIPFVGGIMPVAETVTIIENIETVDYNTDADDDTILDNLPAYRTRYAAFGSGGIETFPFSDLYRLQPYKELKPIGMIEMWSGSVATIPNGYLLCDGTNGTPDLRSRFLVGAGSDYNVGDTGGEHETNLTTAQLPPHNHNGIATSGGQHSHYVTIGQGGGHTRHGHANEGSGTWKGGGGNSSPNSTSVPGNVTYGGLHSHSATIAPNGEHTHTLTIENTGGGQPHENRPPYYALCFIKYVGI